LGRGDGCGPGDGGDPSGCVDDVGAMFATGRFAAGPLRNSPYRGLKDKVN
jgi:hypothetical protein